MKKETRKKLIALLLINSNPTSPEEFKESSDRLNNLSDEQLMLFKDTIQLLFKKELVEFDSCFKLIDFPSKKDWEKFVDEMSHRIKKSRRSIIRSGSYP